MGIAADGESRSIEVYPVRGRERIAAVGDNACGIRDVQHVLLAERVSLPGEVPLVVELVVPSDAVPLKIVIAPSAVVDAVRHQVDVVVAAVALPSDAERDRRLGARIFGHRGAREHLVREWIGDSLPPVPHGRFGADDDAGLHEPVLIECQRGLQAFVGIVVEGVGQRVRIHIIVRRQLRFDVGHRDEAAQAEQEAFRDVWDVQLTIHHRKVVSVNQVVAEQLIARQSIRGRVAIVLPVYSGNPEAPVDVVGLHCIGQAFDIDHGLIELHRVRRVHVGRWPVAPRSHGVGADVAAAIDPAIHLDVGRIHRLAEFSVGERHHQRAVD